MLNAFLNKLMQTKGSDPALQALASRSVLGRYKDDMGTNSTLKSLFSHGVRDTNVNQEHETYHNQALDAIKANPSLDGMVASLYDKWKKEDYDKTMMRPMVGDERGWDRIPFFEQARYPRAPRRY